MTDFSPAELVASSDTHPPRSRIHGLLALVIGILPIGVNEYFLSSDGTFYPKFYILAGALIPLGLFGLAFGLPVSRKLTGQSIAYRVGYFAVVIAGCAAGAFYSARLEG